MKQLCYPYKFVYLSELKCHYMELHQDISHYKLMEEILNFWLYSDISTGKQNVIFIIIILIAPLSSQRLDNWFKESRIHIF
jgi:hypothetical protein